MASLSPPRFSSTTPHFFKIILDGISKYKLKIPKKFVMKYGKDLSNRVCLKLPTGSEWEVELIRSKDRIWFEKGWPEFSMFCSLDYGSFILFRYEGNSHFHVCVMDTSATEIDYPITRPKSEEADEDDDLSIEILEDFQSSPKARRKSLLPCPPCKKMRTRLSGKTDTNSECQNTKPCDMVKKQVTNKEENGFLTKRRDSRDGGSSSSSQKFLKRTHEILGRMEPLTATEKANAIKSVNPSFRIVLSPCSIRYSCLSIPNEFTRGYLMKRSAGIVRLRVADRRTWSVNFKYDRLKSRARLLGGWSSFVSGNSLKVGDVCIFTLINWHNCTEPLFEVVFFPTIDSANCPSSTGHGRGAIVQVEEEKQLNVESDRSLDCKNTLSKISGQVTQMRTSRVNLEAASKFSSKNPFFKVILGSGHTVHIPANFSRTFIKHEKQTVFLQVKSRSWRLSLNPYKPGAISICGGWTKFAQENCLREGDACIFELMEMNEIVLKVHIFRC